jgi:hypothetical protein
MQALSWSTLAALHARVHTFDVLRHRHLNVTGPNTIVSAAHRISCHSRIDAAVDHPSLSPPRRPTRCLHITRLDQLQLQSAPLRCRVDRCELASRTACAACIISRSAVTLHNKYHGGTHQTLCKHDASCTYTAHLADRAAAPAAAQPCKLSP